MMKSLRCWAAFAFLLVVPATVLGQDATIRGRVTDTNGVGLQSATIAIRLLSLGTLSAGNGEFTLAGVPVGTTTASREQSGATVGTKIQVVSAGLLPRCSGGRGPVDI